MIQPTKKPVALLRPAERTQGGHASVPAFEERLSRDSRWALSEGSKFFEGGGAVQATLKKIAKRLGELGIPYAVVGGMALSNHGFPRFTVDVDILVTPESLKEIHQHLDGLGYVPPFRHSKNLRDAETGVKIEFLITGGFPGDGKPKPVAFPDPRAVSVENNGVQYINLPTLIELKLASGMTSTERVKDLGDVQELIKILVLSRDFAETLNPYVREKYVELWRGARPPGKRYVGLWNERFPNIEAVSAPEIDSLPADVASILKVMLADGVSIEISGDDSVAYLVTADPDIADKYALHDESEFWHKTGDEAKDKQ